MTDQVQIFLVLTILLKADKAHSRNVFPSFIQPSPTGTDEIRREQTMFEIDITRIRPVHGTKARKNCIVLLTRELDN
jgi:hypothetical protein